MRLTSENLQTPANPELTANFDNLRETLQTATRCFKSQPIGNLYRTIHCKFFENTLINLHLLGKNKIFDACIEQAKAAGMEVSSLQHALQKLKDLCDESIESNKKIEDIAAYIQTNVIQIIEPFCTPTVNVIERQLEITSQSEFPTGFGSYTLPKDLIHLILSLLTPTNMSLQPKDIALLSLTCKLWHGHLFRTLKDKHEV